jgi:hypothetical protein
MRGFLGNEKKPVRTGVFTQEAVESTPEIVYADGDVLS